MFNLQPEDLSSIVSVLIWLAGGAGGTWLVGYAVAYLAEHWAGWHGLPDWVKTYAPILVSIGIAYGASLALQYPELLETIQPIWALIVLVVVGWTGTQTGHNTAKIRGVSSKAKAK